VLQKLQLTEILDEEVARLHTLKSQNTGKINKGKPRFTSDTEKTVISTSMQCQTESNEGIINISSNPGLQTLELPKISDTICNPPALSEKLNSTLINIQKIRDRNTCEAAEHQRQATKRKTDVENKKRKRKVAIALNSSEAIKVGSDTGADLKKEIRMKAIMKKNVHGVKISDTEHSLPSVKMSAEAQSNEKLKQLDSLKERFSFRNNPPKKTAGIIHDMQAFMIVKDVMDEVSCNQQTHLSAKLSLSTIQKLQHFKRTRSDIQTVSQNIPGDEESLIPVGAVLNSRKGSNTDTVTKEFEAFNDLVTCRKKLSDSQQCSGSGLSCNDDLISLDRNVSRLSLNIPQVFSTGDDDLEDLDFEI
jgi:hypothetical protein